MTLLKKVESALGTIRLPSLATLPKQEGKKRGNKRKVSNEQWLMEAVVQALGRQQLTKDEILTGVKNLGYQFRTANPLNSIGVILYGKKPKFSRKDGKFGVG